MFMSVPKFLSGCILSLCTLSCAERMYVPGPVAVSLDRQQENIADTTLFYSMREVRLESAPEYAINHINKVLMADSTLYIMDKRQKRVLLFGLDGRHMGTIADIGHGRGEYVDLIDVAVDRYRRELLLLVYPKGIMHYTLDGKFKHKDTLDVFFSEIGCDRSFYYLHDAGHSLMAINKETGERRNLLELDGDRAPFCSLSGDDRLYDCGDRLFFTRYFDNNIYELTGGEVTAQYSIDFGKYAFPESEMKERFDCTELFIGAQKRNRIYAITKLKVGRRYAMFSSNLDNLTVFDIQTGRSFFTSAKQGWPYSVALRMTCDYLPVNGTADKVCLVVEPSNLTSVSDLVAKHPENARLFSEHTLQLARSFSLSDNPLLVICSLK